MSRKIRVVPSTMPKILVVPSTMPRIDPEEVAKALGAEPMERLPYVFANFPEDLAQRSALVLGKPAQETPPNRLRLRDDEWKQLLALADELTEGEKKLTPEQIVRLLLRQALSQLPKEKKELQALLLAEEEKAKP